MPTALLLAPRIFRPSYGPASSRSFGAVMRIASNKKKAYNILVIAKAQT